MSSLIMMIKKPGVILIPTSKPPTSMMMHHPLQIRLPAGAPSRCLTIGFRSRNPGQGTHSPRQCTCYAPDWVSNPFYFPLLFFLLDGPKLGKLLAVFPTMYLSGGTCVLFIITGGGIMELLSQLLLSEHHHDSSSSPITGAEWFLIFMCIAILVSQFFPTLDSLASVSLVGSVSAVICFSSLWIVSITTTNHQPLLAPSSPEILKYKSIRGIIDALGMIALTFRGHNLILEIQGTMPTSQQRPARNRMWKGVTASTVGVGLCIFPLAIGGHLAFGTTPMGATTTNGGILDALTSQLLSSHNHKTSSKHKWILATIYLTLLLHLICAFQLYAIPAFDNLERVIYVSRKNKACPRWVRSAIRLFYGGLTYFIAVALPFIGSLGPFFGAISLPLTFAYPCFMWIAIEKRKKSSHGWKWMMIIIINLGVGCLGIGLSLMLGAAALWNLVDYGLDANFFKPR
ncbi:OLC1v1003576C3 [Oldenlandia corymbosa var. corymbosa]|uniref:OLC1v1003576C3 n=1 Tax=Oldenlandia corymbosa var. corymbosa TaxID=529605 RepID=A0AAV1DAC4_OLDCO|nr:OLC1v1003576C3 [Oldenlandia corymbosa var. corymbosa]